MRALRVRHAWLGWLAFAGCAVDPLEPDPTPVDADGDGVTVQAGDCDDHDPLVAAGRPDDAGNLVDENCDGVDGVDGDGAVSTIGGTGAKAATTGLLLINAVDDYRLPNMHSLDARFGRETKIGRSTINIDIDAFNLLNLGTTLGKEYDLALASGNNVLEIMNPRIIRFGVRIGF